MNTGRHLIFCVLFMLLLVAWMSLPALSEAEPPAAPVTVPGRAEAEAMSPLRDYSLNGSHEVDGRQGIAWEGGSFYVSGSTTLSRYDGE